MALSTPKGFLPRGRGGACRPLMESEIKAVQSITKSGLAASRLLRCTYETYKKYAKMYGLFERHKNNGGKGVPKPFGPDVGHHAISKILNGDCPNYCIYKIKDKLFKAGIKEEKCELCNYAEKRLSDGKPPLLINWLDGNSKNHKLENIQILCYNCYHNNVGQFTGRKAWVKLS